MKVYTRPSTVSVASLLALSLPALLRSPPLSAPVVTLAYQRETAPTSDMAYVERVIPLVVTSLLFTIIAGILVLTRIVTRARIGIAGVDDYLAAGALVSLSLRAMLRCYKLREILTAGTSAHRFCSASSSFSVSFPFLGHLWHSIGEGIELTGDVEIKWGLGTPFATIPQENIPTFVEVRILPLPYQSHTANNPMTTSCHKQH